MLCETAVMEKSLDSLAVALCADYDRRERAMREGSFSSRTLLEYDYLNRHIYRATIELCDGEEELRDYIREIGGKIGYAHSRFTVSEVTYKVRKRRIKENILRHLHLYD